MSEKFDIAVIGAGPAGSTLARLLSNAYKVLLVDARELDKEPKPGARKCCGGLIAPDAQKVIAEFGLGLPAGVLAGPQLFAVRTIDLSSGRERFYQRFYINTDREKLDRWLVSLAGGAADARFGCRFKGFERTDGGFRIALSKGGREYAEEASVIVGADGAGSAVRRLAFPARPWPEKYVAIQEWFADGNTAPYFSALFDPAVTDFYCWTIPKEGFLLVGAALAPGPDAQKRFMELKRKLLPFGYSLGTPVRREGALILRPVSLRQVYTGGRGIALVGEAAGFISPSSCEGLSYAFRSAAALAESLWRGLQGFEERYARNAADIRFNILAKNIKSPFMYNPFLRNAVMRSGVKSLHMR